MYSQNSISNSPKGIVTYNNDSANGWTVSNHFSEPKIYKYIWVDTSMNSLINYYQNVWSNSTSLNALT
ncbi:hypothetical protein [uncultured Lutibacter sp.]|uniref:hypothetical protein n=1 Tax=uncultured Lutibacter sp. TaxID=437739 RepID=UPI002606317A|nr:hypothetical protein [uncultured Lutibacter sp.]